ncbi:MAG: hypothetical protein PHT62_00295 [Desulfotomaculaceae bacterium]|nr:hypothetical protein [Desulfotomaculaceae bacterium]
MCILEIFSKEEVLEKAKEYNVKFIRLQFTDIYLYPDPTTFEILPWRPLGEYIFNRFLILVSTLTNWKGGIREVEA